MTKQQQTVIKPLRKPPDETRWAVRLCDGSEWDLSQGAAPPLHTPALTCRGPLKSDSRLSWPPGEPSQALNPPSASAPSTGQLLSPPSFRPGESCFCATCELTEPVPGSKAHGRAWQRGSDLAEMTARKRMGSRAQAAFKMGNWIRKEEMDAFCAGSQPSGLIKHPPAISPSCRLSFLLHITLGQTLFPPEPGTTSHLGSMPSSGGSTHRSRFQRPLVEGVGRTTPGQDTPTCFLWRAAIFSGMHPEKSLVFQTTTPRTPGTSQLWLTMTVLPKQGAARKPCRSGRA